MYGLSLPFRHLGINDANDRKAGVIVDHVWGSWTELGIPEGEPSMRVFLQEGSYNV